MRGPRRIHPSQVGYARSIARRRLLHAYSSSAAPQDTAPSPLAGLSLVIRLDADGAALPSPDDAGRGAHDRATAHELVAVTARTRNL